MTESQRNLLILVLLAVVGVMFSGQFNLGAGIIGMALSIAFALLIITFLVMQYRRNATTIASLPATPRLVLQAAGIVLIVAVASGMLPLPAPLDWLAHQPALMWTLLLGSGFAIWWAWQQRTNRW